MKIAATFFGLVALCSMSVGDTGNLNPIVEADGRTIDGNVQVRLGGQLTMKCSIINAWMGPYDVSWTYPSSFDGNNMRTRVLSNSINFQQNVTKLVTLENIEENSAGLWTCTVRSPRETKTATLTLVVDAGSAAGSAVKLECGTVLLLSAWILYQSLIVRGNTSTMTSRR